MAMPGVIASQLLNPEGSVTIPTWVPDGVEFFVDFANDRAWVNDAEVTASELIATPARIVAGEGVSVLTHTFGGTEDKIQLLGDVADYLLAGSWTIGVEFKAYGQRDSNWPSNYDMYLVQMYNTTTGDFIGISCWSGREFDYFENGDAFDYWERFPSYFWNEAANSERIKRGAATRTVESNRISYGGSEIYEDSTVMISTPTWPSVHIGGCRVDTVPAGQLAGYVRSIAVYPPQTDEQMSDISSEVGQTFTVLSSATVSNIEGRTLGHSLEPSRKASWSIVGGADQAKFTIASDYVLNWVSGTKDFETPDDADTDNDYLVTVRATDEDGNTVDQAITVSVVDGASNPYWTNTFNPGGFTAPPSTAYSGLLGDNIRIRIPASLMLQSGDKFRLTLQRFTGVTGVETKVISCYAGHRNMSGANEEFDGTQVQVTFGSSPSVVIDKGETIVSDEMTYSVDETKDFIVHLYHDEDSTINSKGSTGVVSYYSTSGAASGVDESALNDIDTSAYSTVNNTIYGLIKIEVQKTNP